MDIFLLCHEIWNLQEGHSTGIATRVTGTSDQFPFTLRCTCLIQLLILIGHLFWVVCGQVWLQERKRHVFKIGLLAQNMITITGSIVNINGGDPFAHLMSTGIFTLIMNNIFVWVQKIMRKWLRHQFGFANHFVLLTCLISQEKWASWKT